MDNVKYKINILWQRLRDYIGKDLEPKKCPYCKCKKLETYETFRHDQGFVEEYWVRCSKCKEHIGTCAYGSWYLK